MRITITIDCDNASFDGNDCARELGHLFDEMKWRITHGTRHGVADALDDTTFRDTNGNTVGRVEVTE